MLVAQNCLHNIIQKHTTNLYKKDAMVIVINLGSRVDSDHLECLTEEDCVFYSRSYSDSALDGVREDAIDKLCTGQW